MEPDKIDQNTIRRLKGRLVLAGAVPSVIGEFGE
jgi:hypothetical protein